ncbi:MAG: hypothetical protein U9R02_14725 [Thermodesulfobacteriota bacterium]|nr:hypothetical protein [Thermodesulfobacteriota bacterium]
MKLIKFKKQKGCTIDCTIDLDLLFETKDEIKKFNGKWKDFIASDPDNKKVYKKKGAVLKYKSEQLIPIKKDKRPSLLLILGNPATHSVESEMFFSFEGDRKEHRFWSRILKPAGVLDLPFEPGLSIEKLNKQRRDALFNLDYESGFRIGLSVIISMPSTPGGPWGGIAGVQKLIGAKAMRRLEQAETERMLECAKKFVNPKGAVIAFQKNAWNNLCSKSNPKYDLKLARAGKLKGHLKGDPGIPLLCVPPTRLCGPCSRVLKRFL